MNYPATADGGPLSKHYSFAEASNHLRVYYGGFAFFLIVRHGGWRIHAEANKTTDAKRCLRESVDTFFD